MNQCDAMQVLISRMLDEEPEPQERVALEAHVAVCPDCRTMFETFAAVSDSLRNDLEEPPERLHESVMAEVRRDQIWKKNLRPWRALLSAAAVAALVLGIRFAAGDVKNEQLAAMDTPVLFAAAKEVEYAMDNGAVEEAAAGNASAQSESASIMQVPTAAARSSASGDAAVQDRLESAAINAQESRDESGQDMAALLDYLGGDAVRLALDPVAAEPILRLTVADGAVEIFEYEGELYYFDPASHMPMRTERGLEELTAWISG